MRAAKSNLRRPRLGPSRGSGASLALPGLLFLVLLWGIPGARAQEPASSEPRAAAPASPVAPLVRRMMRWARAGAEPRTSDLLEEALAAGPREATFALDLARRLRDAPVAAALVRAAEEALARGADPHEGNRLLAEGRARARDFEGAREALDRAIETRPDCEECRDRLATLCASYRRYAAAVDAQKWLVARNPADPARRLRLARYLVELQRYDEALAAARDARGLAAEESREALTSRIVEATALEAKGEAERGLASLAPLGDLARLPPDLATEARYVEGLLRERTGDLAKAVSALRASLPNPAFEALAHYRLGRILLRMGRHEEGRHELDLYEQTRKRERFAAQMGLPPGDG